MSNELLPIIELLSDSIPFASYLPGHLNLGPVSDMLDQLKFTLGCRVGKS